MNLCDYTHCSPSIIAERKDCKRGGLHSFWSFFFPVLEVPQLFCEEFFWSFYFSSGYGFTKAVLGRMGFTSKKPLGIVDEFSLSALLQSYVTLSAY